MLLNVALPLVNYGLENSPNVPIFREGSTAENIFVGVIYGFETCCIEGLVFHASGAELNGYMAFAAFKITGAISLIWGCVVFTVSYVFSLVEPGTEYDFFVHVSFYGIVSVIFTFAAG